MVKAYQIRDNTKAELHKQLAEFKEELNKLRIHGEVRKNIARVLTVLTAQNRANLRELYKGKKHIPLDLRPKKTRAIRRRLTKEEASSKTLKQIKREAAFPKRKYAVKA